MDASWHTPYMGLCVLVACTTVAQLQAASAGPYNRRGIAGPTGLPTLEWDKSANTTYRAAAKQIFGKYNCGRILLVFVHFLLVLSTFHHSLGASLVEAKVEFKVLACS